VVGLAVPGPDQTILTITTNGYGKRTDINDYRHQKRAGSGVINIKLRKDGKVSGSVAVNGDEDVVVVTSQGVVIRQKVNTISVYGRSTKGVMIQKLGKKDYIAAFALVPIQDEEDETPEGEVIEGEVIETEGVEAPEVEATEAESAEVVSE
jgi:DNA gyrase subunit A